ncbi:hypothetical protein C8Q70DRAFT_979763 [Cubamyces menziesii]|nr:hypothetical protein C8Q70DRAFT_979763 [Cubamyces menziesii]
MVVAERRRGSARGRFRGGKEGIASSDGGRLPVALADGGRLIVNIFRLASQPHGARVVVRSMNPAVAGASRRILFSWNCLMKNARRGECVRGRRTQVAQAPSQQSVHLRRTQCPPRIPRAAAYGAGPYPGDGAPVVRQAQGLVTRFPGIHIGPTAKMEFLFPRPLPRSASLGLTMGQDGKNVAISADVAAWHVLPHILPDGAAYHNVETRFVVSSRVVDRLRALG